MTNGIGEKLAVVENKNFEGVEVGVQLADLDSSCLGGRSQGGWSAEECSLIQHGFLTLVVGCPSHLVQTVTMQSHTESDGIEI